MEWEGEGRGRGKSNLRNVLISMAGLVSVQTTGFIIYTALYEAKLRAILLILQSFDWLAITEHKAERQIHVSASREMYNACM